MAKAKKPIPTNHKIEITLETLLESITPLQSIMGQSMTAVVSFRLKKTLSSIDKQIKLYHETRKEKMEQFGELDDKKELVRDEEGQMTFKSDEDKKSFQEQMETLMKEKVKIKADFIKLPDLKEVKVSPNALYVLDWLIKEK